MIYLIFLYKKKGSIPSLSGFSLVAYVSAWIYIRCVDRISPDIEVSARADVSRWMAWKPFGFSFVPMLDLGLQLVVVGNLVVRMHRK